MVHSNASSPRVTISPLTSCQPIPSSTKHSLIAIGNSFQRRLRCSMRAFVNASMMS
jgi:hypothetical protein